MAVHPFYSAKRFSGMGGFFSFEDTIFVDKLYSLTFTDTVSRSSRTMIYRWEVRKEMVEVYPHLRLLTFLIIQYNMNVAVFEACNNYFYLKFAAPFTGIPPTA